VYLEYAVTVRYKIFMTTPLSIRSVTKSFDGRTVLDAVSLDLQQGEIFGLIGLNGIGKTTLIKIILGLIRSDAGEVSIYGDDWRDVAAKHHLAYLPEKFQPSRFLTGKEILSLAHSYYGKAYDHALARTQAALLGLDPDVLGKRVSSYSKGMGQKIGLIATLMVGTKLVILDEPMSGLDPKARIQLKARLRAVREEGRTIFFSSHILADIDEICDRIAIIHDTAFKFVGTTAEFKNAHPAVTLEQAFLDVIGEQQVA
jgi:ABC-2 type transport system ATP-binding protein